MKIQTENFIGILISTRLSVSESERNRIAYELRVTSNEIFPVHLTNSYMLTMYNINIEKNRTNLQLWLYVSSQQHSFPIRRVKSDKHRKAVNKFQWRKAHHPKAEVMYFRRRFDSFINFLQRKQNHDTLMFDK